MFQISISYVLFRTLVKLFAKERVSRIERLSITQERERDRQIE